jgi:hypothetical protein
LHTVHSFRPHSASAKEAYFEVKRKELQVSLDKMDRRKGKEEELLETRLLEHKLLVRQRRLKILLLQASLRVQLLTEKKLTRELAEEERGQVASDKEEEEEEEEEFIEAVDTFEG